MVHISIKLFLKDIKTKGQLNEEKKKKETGPTERIDETVVQPYTGMSDKSNIPNVQK